MIAPGWSAGDIMMAIQVVLKIAEAFDNAKGARTKYAASSCFLRGLAPVLQKIHQCVECPGWDQYHEDIMAQAVIIHAAYESFEEQLIKRKDLVLQRQSTVDKLRYLAQVIMSGLDELHGKVEKLQTRVVNAVAFIGPILAFEIRAKTEDLTKSVDRGFENNDTYQGQITELLNSIQIQTSSLQVMSSDYKVQLTSAMAEGRQDREREMGLIQNNVKTIEESQEKLTESLTVLTQRIHEQHEESKSTSAANAKIWARLSEDAATQKHVWLDIFNEDKSLRDYRGFAGAKPIPSQRNDA
ncbi:MAG: hypothetical protein Q9224_006247 [Gallowayella concinna]